MADHAPRVALLFDDAALSGHLREALVEHGATIVYESDLRAFAPAELVGSSADVVVIDLDDPGDDDLDRLYDTVESGHPRLVFNDSDVSRHLEGWARARWARHLAAKLVGVPPPDPVRPGDARALEPRLAAIASVAAPAEEIIDLPLTDDLAITGAHGYAASPFVSTTDETAVSMDAVPDIASDVADPLVFSTALSTTDDDEGVDPADLAAELEALLADTDASAISTDGLEDVPSAPLELTELASLDLSGFEVVDETPTSASVPERAFDLSQFSLASDDTAPPVAVEVAMPALDIEHRATEYAPPPAPSWDLVDHDTITADTPARPDASEFGIETLTAAEYLAQDVVDDGSHGVSPGMSLELVSLEEAIAPRTDGAFSHEMFLEGSARAVRRVVVLAGGGDSEASVAAFLAAVPTSLPAVLLVAVHHDDTQHLSSQLGDLAVAGQQSHTAHGERLVVPRGTRVQVRRDGRVVVGEDDSASRSAGPSLDDVLATVAEGFGADALAIVFDGRGSDAVAGAQAVYDAGGRVWIESVPIGDERGHAVAGIREERVAAYAGDAAALAQKLIEEFP
ncbi:chemotaxis protein CheB [Luteibacter sp. 9135]|uniref:chemotaxis protein CheB n=1 Tax=Luteibacter sp. 9135 TaxID=1500893 RepID=UPI00056A7521|nr:chemotaxis protein CheB [Luteibacter sp. 9135]